MVTMRCMIVMAAVPVLIVAVGIVAVFVVAMIHGLGVVAVILVDDFGILGALRHGREYRPADALRKLRGANADCTANWNGSKLCNN
jgi:fatty acid desaturase